MLSKKAGKPVKVVWSREDDIRFDYYHSVSAAHMKAAVDEKGRPTAWLQRNAFPTIGSTFQAGAESPSPGELQQGWTDIPYDLPNLRVENGPAAAHVRIVFLRTVANIYQTFAVQTFTDELVANARRSLRVFAVELLGLGKIDFKAMGLGYPNLRRFTGRVSGGYGAAA